MKMKLKATVGSLLVTVVAAGAAVVPASSQAAQIGDLCWIHTTHSVVYVYTSEYLDAVAYTLLGGQAFRILGYGGSGMTVPTYYGRGNGTPNGHLPRMFINQATCTQ